MHLLCILVFSVYRNVQNSEHVLIHKVIKNVSRRIAVNLPLLSANLMNCKMDFPQKNSEYQWYYNYKYSTVYKILTTVLQKLISTQCLVCRFVGVHLMSLIMSHFAIYTLTACSLLMIKTSTHEVNIQE